MPDATQAHRGALTLMRGDLTLLDVEAIVFYAEHSLKLGSGYGGAISMRGGPSIQAELDSMGPIETCEVVATAAGELKTKHILHAVGPRFREDDLEEKLRTTIRNTLALAVAKGVKRIAFPAMGAGFYGVPLDICATVMVEEFERHLTGDDSVDEAIICVQDLRELGPFQARFEGS